MKIRRLIINADDCNLTAGVTQGILQAHDQGGVSSTTILINLPLESETVRALKKRRRLGLGLHLNVTLEHPVSPVSRVRSLMKDGRFRRPADYAERAPSLQELIREYEAQIVLFQKHFGTKPDHLDTHHHLHDREPFFKAVAAVAKRWKLPIRRSQMFQREEFQKQAKMLRTTDYLFGNLEAKFIWEEAPFLGIVETLPEGTSEIGCHPGYCDAELRAISSFREARERELKLFSNSRLRKVLSPLGIELVRFSEI